MTRKLLIEFPEGLTVFEVLENETVIGRDADCDLTLDTDRASRRHARLLQVDDQLLIEDMGSRNGTAVRDEALVGKRLLESGDWFEIGGIRFFVDRAPKTASAAVASTSSPPPSRRAAGDRKRRSRAPLLVLSTVGLAAVWIVTRFGNEDPPRLERPSKEIGATAKPMPPEPQGPRNAPLLGAVDTARAEARSKALQLLGVEIEELLLREDWTGARRALDRFAKDMDGPAMGLERKLESALETAGESFELEYRRRLREGDGGVARSYLQDRVERLPEGAAVRKRLERVLADRLMADSGAAPATPGPEAGKPQTPPAAIPLRRREDPPAQVAKPKPPVAGTETAAEKTFFASAGEAENAWLERRYEDAAAHYARAVEIARQAEIPREIEEEIGRKQRAAERMVSFRVGLFAALKRDPGVATAIPLAAGRKGDLTRIDGDVCYFNVDGVEAAYGFRTLVDEALEALARKASFEAAEGLGAAAFLIARGKIEAGHRLLRLAELTADPSGPSAIDSILADAARSDVPRGGYVWRDKVYVSRKDLERMGAAEQVKGEAARLRDPKASVREAAYAKLAALGDIASGAFQQALVAAKEDMLKSMEPLGGFKELQALLGEHQHLVEARSLALELIFDTEKYPYPYRDRGPEIAKLYQETQREIDDRVRVIREIWGSTTTATLSKELIAARERLFEYEAQLDKLDLGNGPAIPEFLLNWPEGHAVTLRTFALDAEERERIDDSAVAMRENAEKPNAASVGEKREVEVTNEYRVMMGRHAVRICDKLVECARMHSTDMSKGGWFSHMNPNDPKKRSPSDRATYVGFEGVGISENIAMNPGGAEGAHNAWIHSSGHHRNILSASWRILGVGNAGSYWTQNFSIHEYTAEEKKSRSGIEGEARTPEDEGR